MTHSELLAAASIAPEVTDLRPDYRALLLTVTGLPAAASDAGSEALLVQAEAHAAELLASAAVTELPHVAAWRETYKAFGAKPQKFRNSLEALTRRAAKGLPRINRLTDTYNALSIIHQIPMGGENLDAYVGAPRLVRVDGTESFDTSADGEIVVEHAEAGEVAWTDDAGITCRRWNWRQCHRTALHDDTANTLFILDALDPVTTEDLRSAGDALAEALAGFGPDVAVETRLLSA